MAEVSRELQPSGETKLTYLNYNALSMLTYTFEPDIGIFTDLFTHMDQILAQHE